MAALIGESVPDVDVFRARFFGVLLVNFIELDGLGVESFALHRRQADPNHGNLGVVERPDYGFDLLPVTLPPAIAKGLQRVIAVAQRLNVVDPEHDHDEIMPVFFRQEFGGGLGPVKIIVAHETRGLARLVDDRDFGLVRKGFRETVRSHDAKAVAEDVDVEIGLHRRSARGSRRSSRRRRHEVANFLFYLSYGRARLRL